MRRVLVALLACGLALAGCGGDDGPVTLTLVTHDSFAVSEEVLASFTEQTGIKVKVLKGGDAGAVVNKAILTNGNPQGDVLYGIDNTFLSRALDENLFVPYEADGLDAVDERYLLDDEHHVTPIDRADVCLNYDKAYFEASLLSPPDDLDDLVDPAYRGLTVVENPATSSPGLAFLLGTVAEYGEDGWTDWWQQLRDNDVAVADGWEDAYYGSFSGGTGSEGDRPIVVSYASSPPAEVVFSEAPIDEPPIGVVEASCVQQVEMAGILRGTEHEDEAGKLIDFMLSTAFQEDMPLNMFVFPVNPDAELPEVFTQFAAQPENAYEVPPADVAAHRDEWIETWADIVIR